MGSIFSTVIKGSGVYIPKNIIANSSFINHEFFGVDGQRLSKTNEEIIKKFQEITKIDERRYANNNVNCSDMGKGAAKAALESAAMDSETLDYIICAHNFGEVISGNGRVDYMPTMSARIKHKLKIKNPYCVCLDVPFGCPGWVQAMITADYLIKSGDAKRILVVGSETLSRVIDDHDMDCMIFADGAGAVVVESEEKSDVGIISHLTRSDTYKEAFYLYMDKSYNPNGDKNVLTIKMEGHKIYEYSLNIVPQLIADTIKKANLSIQDISKVLIHQANSKMDEAILKRLLRLYGIKEIPQNLMPMTIQEFGNNSVATVPILYHLISNGLMNNHKFSSGDNLVMASIGAGMNINALVYRIP